MLDLPHAVHPELVGQLDLIESILQQLVLALRPPRPRQLMLVEQSELHMSDLLEVERSCRWPELGGKSTLVLRGEGFLEAVALQEPSCRFVGSLRDLFAGVWAHEVGAVNRE